MEHEDEGNDRLKRAVGRQRSGGTITLVQLETFVAIIRHKGLKRAAHALGDDESTLRERIKKLEDWLGKQLFFRRPTFKLAPDGHAFRPIAEKVVNLLVTSRNEVSMRDLAALTGTDLQAAIQRKYHPVTDEVIYEID